MEPYKTQQDLMAKKAKEKGIPTIEITKKFQQILSEVYQQNPHCAEAWALGKAEYSVWKEFFPNDPWPGASLKTKQSPFNNETMSPESGEVTDSPDRMVLPSLPSRPKSTFSINVEEVLVNAAGNATILVAYRDALVNMKERYPRESLEWQQWMSGSKVWLSNFRQNGTFPCIEPPRSYALRSSDANGSITGQPRSSGEVKSRGGPRGGSSWRAESITSRRRSRSPPSGPREIVGYRQGRNPHVSPNKVITQGRTIKVEDSSRNGEVMRVVEPLSYGPKENEMQEKAFRMGGELFRHEFFRALQGSRDTVRACHPNYNRSMKHWLADRMAWEKIFKNEPFPWLNNKPPMFPLNDKSSNTGNFSMAPPPAQGVAKKFNVKATVPIRNNSLAPQQNDRYYRPVYFLPNNIPSNLRDSSNSKNPLSSPEMPRKPPAAFHEKHSEKAGGEHFEGIREVTLRKNVLFRALLGDWDDSFKSVQRALGVTMEYKDDASEHLKLIIEPYQPGDNAALERAYEFLEIWKKMIYSDHLIKLEHFWAQYKSHDKTTSADREYIIHVNGKKIPCPGKFGDLCDFFSHEIQNYQSAMAQFNKTENALACSTLFEATPYNIKLTSFPLPIMLQADSKARNKVLEDHDGFLEEWVRSAINTRIGLSDMSKEFGRRRQNRMSIMDMDLDELLKEGAAKAANQ